MHKKWCVLQHQKKSYKKNNNNNKTKVHLHKQKKNMTKLKSHLRKRRSFALQLFDDECLKYVTHIACFRIKYINLMLVRGISWYTEKSYRWKRYQNVWYKNSVNTRHLIDIFWNVLDVLKTSFETSCVH